MEKRKYRRMTVSFEVLMLAPESEELDGYFYDSDISDKMLESFTLTDLEEEDVLADMSLPGFRDSTSRAFQTHLTEWIGIDGISPERAAFLATLCERFFITDITIGKPVEYEEPTR